MSAESYRLGIDVGGTFTDLVVWASSGGLRTFKVPTTPADPSVGVLDGLRAIARALDLAPETFAGRILTIVHGTTVTTNATLTRRGAKTGLITTAGVRDALEMRRGIREDAYDNRLRNVVPLVPRYLRRPVRGRLDWRGDEIESLAAEGVRDAVAVFRREGVAAVAVCFLNAFANPAHERAAAEIVRQEMPEAFVSVSSEVLPAIRFYNRVSTTVLDAYVGPVLKGYLGSLTRSLHEAGFRGALLVMQSSGGVALPEATIRRPSATLLSGPAAAPRAAAAYAGETDCITVDMGGTSFDASIVRRGEVELEPEGDIERMRIALPMLDIVTIGAGGGSIGRVDAGGLLRMGPASAGADPGPACYGRGGELPTSTDANVVLGYLDPGWFAGGTMRLDAERARAAVARHVAAPLGLDVERAAVGMVRVIDSNMAHGVREITVKRGLDPRGMPLVVAGGAGPLHGCAIATELGIETVLVPPVASVLCAAGMLLTDLQQDQVRSCVAPLAKLDPARLETLVREMEESAAAHFRRAELPEDRIEHEVLLDLRYLKQYHEVTVQVPREAVREGDLGPPADAFHTEHDRLYGYHLRAEGTGIELINVRVRSFGRTDKPILPPAAEGGLDASHARKGMRRAWVQERERFEDVCVYDGHALRAGNMIAGPALVERTDTTIVIGAAFAARVDARGTCAIARHGGSRTGESMR